MRTNFGRALAKIRIDRNELLKEMADRMNMNSAELSGLEHGRAEVTDDWLAWLFVEYSDLTTKEQESLVKGRYLDDLAKKKEKKEDERFTFSR